MTILLFGCGYLGTRIAPRLQASGHEVTVTTTTEARREELSALSDHVIVTDVAALGCESFDQSFDAVVYAVSASGGRDPRICYVDGPSKVYEALSTPPERFILVSSTGVYAQNGGEYVDEDSDAISEAGNHAWIRQGEEAALHENPPACILRLAGIYGPDRNPAEWLKKEAFRERLKSSGLAWMNWIHVDDAARAVISACEKGEPGRVYNVTDGHPVRRAEVYSVAAAVAGVDAPVLPVDDEGLGKRCSNARLVEELGIVPRFTSIIDTLESLA